MRQTWDQGKVLNWCTVISGGFSNVWIIFSFIRVVPVPDYSYARIGHQCRRDCDHVGRHSGGIYRDASTRRHAGRQNWQFQGQLLCFFYVLFLNSCNFI